MNPTQTDARRKRHEAAAMVHRKLSAVEAAYVGSMRLSTYRPVQELAEAVFRLLDAMEDK